MFAALVGRDEVRVLLRGEGTREGKTDSDGLTAEEWAKTQR